MWIAVIFFALVLAGGFFELRIRKPDRIVLRESRGRVKVRMSRLYPRHFSLALPATVYSLSPEIEAEAKGKLAVRVRAAVTVCPSTDHLPELIRIGGWHEDAVVKAAGELEVILQALVRAFAQRFEIEELSIEPLKTFLEEKLEASISGLGLDLVSVNIRAIDPIDDTLAEAVRRRESDRVIEETEAAAQKARVTAAQARIEADEKIAQAEHGFHLKKLSLRKQEEQKEAELARTRVEEELNCRRMQIAVDKEELELVKDNPELILLTPQAARFAEASQGLRNARTVVSLSSGELNEKSPLMSLLHSLLGKFGQEAAAKNLDNSHSVDRTDKKS